MAKFKVYLSGAMEAYAGTDKAKEWREYCKKYFRTYTDITVFSPTDYYEYGKNAHKTEYEVFKYDLNNLRKADIVLINLNDIRKSIGTCIEVYEAYKNNIPVIGFIDKELPIEEMIKEIHPWIYCCIDRIESGNDSLNNSLHYISNYYG